MAQDISKMETTQTAVEWLVEQFNLQAYIPHIQQAKAMEKEQIVDAATWGYLAETGEQYYKEKYKQ